MRSFWASSVVAVTAKDVKNRHLREREEDNHARWSVRKNLRDDGVTSNLFPIDVDHSSVVFRYELDVTRKPRPTSPGDTSKPARVAAPVPPNRAWRMFAQSLRKYPTLPPLARVANRVYTTVQLPEEMTELPKEYHDMGWERCRLQLVDKITFGKLSLLEIRQLLNKMLPWALSYHARKDGNFGMVRDSDGKMVCTDEGISVAGLRIFHGTTAAILNISTDGSVEAEDVEDVPPSRALETLKPLQKEEVVNGLQVRCVKDVRSFQFRGALVRVFKVKDASGTMAITFWGCPEDIMQEKKNYVLNGVTVKSSNPKYARPDADLNFSVELHGFKGVSAVNEVQLGDADQPVNTEKKKSSDSQQLALRLDTRCTVASEKSLWEEIKQHFGPGPYNEDQQRRISRAVQGTPAVMSCTLRHTAVRVVRFNFSSPDDAPLDPSLRQFAAEFERGQPYAVLNDFSIVPLQVLHCCFDPKMRSWQDVTSPACSFMPNRRGGVLDKFRVALRDGLGQWGVGIGEEPWVTKNIALLPEPAKKIATNIATRSFPSTGHRQISRPRTIAVVSVCNPRAAPEDKEKCVRTAQLLAKNFRTTILSEVTKEDEALRWLHRELCPTGVLKDDHTAVLIVAPEKETRGMRWLMAECLKRGILPVMLRGVAGEKKAKLLCGNIGLQMKSRYQFDPLEGSNIGNEVDSLKSRNALIIGVDACHTHDVTTGACVGLLLSPHGNSIFPTFWRNEVRGQEVEQVAQNFGNVIESAASCCGGAIDECVVFQDGNVFSELESMRARVPASTGLSFMCLHKRTNIRFVHKDQKKKAANVIKGSVVQALTPLPHGYKPEAPSFYLQNHDCNMSTARTVQYTVHHMSPTIPLADIQKLSFVLSHVGSPMSTKLPLTTRCAHRLSSIAERLIDVCPDFNSNNIPENLRRRTWFL